MSLEKNIVGSWGAELSDDEYACALAALGALEFVGTAESDPNVLAKALREEFVAGERTVVWREALDVNQMTILSSWSDTLHTNPAALAAAWREYQQHVHHARQAPRIAVRLDWRNRTDLFNIHALREWLAHPAVRLGALIFEAPRMATRDPMGWHWPLRVGVLPGADHSKFITALDLAQKQHPWIRALSQQFIVGRARDACDLLLVTSLDEPALRSEKRTHIRAGFVASLADPPADLAAAREQYGTLAANLRAAGVGWVGKLRTPKHIADWFEAVIREVSHDVPIITTLSIAGSRCQNRAPLIIGRAHALDQCRILAIAERQDRIVVALGGERSSQPAPSAAATPHEPTASDPAPMPDRRAELTFGGGPDLAHEAAAKAPWPLRGIVGDFADQLRNREFIAESVDGVQAVGDLKYRETVIGEARPPRWIQAIAYGLNALSFAKRPPFSATSLLRPWSSSLPTIHGPLYAHEVVIPSASTSEIAFARLPYVVVEPSM